MPINNGQLEGMISLGDSGEEIRYTIQYDQTQGLTPGVGYGFDPALQPLINRAGSCLKVTNTSPSARSVVVTSPTAGAQTVPVPPGTTTRTAAQLSAVGYRTRADVQSVSFAAA